MDPRLGKLYGTVLADSFTLRRLSANAVRFGLGRQLDWRVDLMLDATGLHILSMRAMYVLTEDRQTEMLFEMQYGEDGRVLPVTARQPALDGEHVIRTSCLLKLPHTMEPLSTELDLRLRDYMTLPPAGQGRGAAHQSGLDMDMRVGDMLPDRDSPDINKASSSLHEAAERTDVGR